MLLLLYKALLLYGTTTLCYYSYTAVPGMALVSLPSGTTCSTTVWYITTLLYGTVQLGLPG